MDKHLNALFIEDSEDDCVLVTDLLKTNGFSVRSRRVEDEEGVREALRDRSLQIVFADYLMPHFDAPRALTIFRESGLDIPFIVVSGSIGEDVAVAAMRAGAHDYVLKSNLARLPAAVERELREAENRRLKRRAETERAIQSEELARRAEQLYRSNKDLERFAYLAAHDLSEPLRVISLYCDLVVRRQPEEEQERRNDLDVIRSNALRMQEMVRGMLDYSRITHEPGISRSEVDPNVVLERVRDQMHPMLEEAGASITSDTLPLIIADARQLEQVFINLISNAVKYRKPAERCAIHVSARSSGNDVRFAVADNGIGIAPEYHDQIFQIFRRLHGNEYPGVGVGLSLVRRLIENHGGRMAVESQEGKGATFYFTLPAVRKSAAV